MCSYTNTALYIYARYDTQRVHRCIGLWVQKSQCTDIEFRGLQMEKVA